MYFGTWTHRGLRLGFEGAEVVADAAEPVAQLDEDEARAWLAGEDLPLHGTFRQPFVILRWGDMVLGCGLALGETIRNRVPKDRRIARDAVVLED